LIKDIFIGPHINMRRSIMTLITNQIIQSLMDSERYPLFIFLKYKIENTTHTVRTIGMIVSKSGDWASLSGKIGMETTKGINQRKIHRGWFVLLISF
jgi:hypothetical protein